MKKLDVLFCCIVLVLAVVYCNVSTANSARAELDEAYASKLELERRGTYNLNELKNTDIFVYRFDNPNADICVYKASNYIYLVGKDDGETAYGEFLRSDSQFVGLSDKYILFLTEDGLTVFQFPFDEGHNAVHAWADLSDEEQGAFIYPVSYEKYSK